MTGGARARAEQLEPCLDPVLASVGLHHRLGHHRKINWILIFYALPDLKRGVILPWPGQQFSAQQTCPHALPVYRKGIVKMAVCVVVAGVRDR